jgi:hypothetical protein
MIKGSGSLSGYLQEVLEQPLAPLAILGLALVIYGSFAKTRWGINFRPPKHCSRCRSPLRRRRNARSTPQITWGGYTCPTCGAELDKWGRELAPSSHG